MCVAAVDEFESLKSKLSGVDMEVETETVTGSTYQLVVLIDPGAFRTVVECVDKSAAGGLDVAATVRRSALPLVL
jgi:hypothetical protein